MGIIVLLTVALVMSIFANLILLHRASDKLATQTRDGMVRPLGDLRYTKDRVVVEGVAVALLLHAPKWFQRRYTMMVQNVHNNMPSNWKLQIFYTPFGASQVGIDLNLGLKRMVASGKVVLTEISPAVIAQRKKRIELMTHPWIWENMLADSVFVFGGNGVICSNSPMNISVLSSKFSYIGTPWSQFKGRGGDGGMSFRNRKLMIAAINYEQRKTNDSNVYKSWGQEDHFFVKTLIEMEQNGAFPKEANMRIANQEETRNYGAMGNIARDSVFVASGTLPGLDDKERDAFIQLCPEIKTFYPSLHNPNCFGALVHKDECAASICALTKRHGGC